MFKDLPNDIINYDNYKVEDVQKLIIDDRNQAYTSLVEGINGMEAPEFSEYDLEALHEGFFLALSHILENVVKPLYGKE